jgi:hypothetical protein
VPLPREYPAESAFFTITFYFNEGQGNGVRARGGDRRFLDDVANVGRIDCQVNSKSVT